MVSALLIAKALEERADRHEELASVGKEEWAKCRRERAAELRTVAQLLRSGGVVDYLGKLKEP